MKEDISEEIFRRRIKRLKLLDPFLLFSFCFCSLLLIPFLFMDGMFMDGEIYACVGRNLADGNGTFWQPTFSSTYMTSYHEQPPLIFGIEAIFFKIFGGSFFTERIICLFLAIVAGYPIFRFWKIIFPDNNSFQKIAWLPILFFLITPLTFWSFQNNVAECYMVVFVLLSVYFQLKAWYSKSYFIIYCFFGGLALAASSMCKGVQGLFPIVLPTIWWIVLRDQKFTKAILQTVIIISVPIIFYGLLFLNDNIFASFKQYYHDRIEATFNIASTATTQSHFSLLWRLPMELILPILLAFLCFIKSKNSESRNKKLILSFFLLGLSGILPLMVTLEQRRFYLLTGLPFITTALAILAAPYALSLSGKLLQSVRTISILKMISLVLISITLISTIALAGKPKRDRNMLQDVQMIGKKCGEKAIISVPYEVFSIWSFQVYLNRYFKIALSVNEENKYYISKKTSPKIPEGYLPVALNTMEFNLFEKMKK